MTPLPDHANSPVLVRGPASQLPTEHGVFTIHPFSLAGLTHAVLSMGDPTEANAPLVRVHSECLTGDALGSHRCDCGDQLSAALHAIALAGNGLLIYMRGHEGRGIGLENKLRAYALQDGGLDTVEANRALDLPDDARDYTVAAEILRAFNCPRITLLSSNPSKVEALETLGITVAERKGLHVPQRPENTAYLETKRQFMNHIAPDAPAQMASPVPVTPGVASASAQATPRVYEAIAAGQDVVAQLAQSQDGFIATSTGDAEFVSGHIDRTHLHRIRAAVGAVLVGCSTVIADDPQLTVRAVPGENPVRVILDPHGRLPAHAQVLTSPEAPTLWLLGADAKPHPNLGEHVRVVRLPDGHEGDTPPAEILALIREHVPGAVLVEGGGRTVSSFLSAGVLDRLFLTTAPVLIGDGVPGIRFAGASVMADALRTSFRRYDFGEDTCIEYLLSDKAVSESKQASVQSQNVGFSDATAK